MFHPSRSRLFYQPNNILCAVQVTNRHFVQFFCNPLPLLSSKVKIPSPTPYYRTPSTKEHDHRQQETPNSQLADPEIINVDNYLYKHIGKSAHNF